MTMVELRLLCPQATVEAIGDALLALGAQSVSTSDADADSPSERALFGEPGLPPPAGGWAHSLMAALFTDEAAARIAHQQLTQQDPHTGCTLVGIDAVPEQDWVRLTQSQFEPVAITPDFWIVPSWHQVPPAARHVIRLDPGLAFGTGTHPTTCMCLRWIATHPLRAARVLDYGCGSGILAIAAALHGAATVDAIDIDPAAVKAARENAEANRVQLHVVGVPDQASGPYDVVLANILAMPLTVLAPLLCGLVAPGGTLVLAGILDRQVQSLQQAYGRWLGLAVSDQMDGWVLLTGRRA